eukprot:CAMPEP_0182515628 /NCGR_PEP_ID=MMETSP1321-20130603/38529_1 /TAXON_ID=91990 /ORGANISM="Bolidomonas sp., Strain RCC1657" /LENGTH=64 /DNA_ID=CAMNT_0024723081 /DNA_START=126 /DNA_END=320 /DNA_ORIENTATION=-
MTGRFFRQGRNMQSQSGSWIGEGMMFSPFSFIEAVTSSEDGALNSDMKSVGFFGDAVEFWIQEV